MEFSRLDHIALTCADVERSQQWYCELLGFSHVFPGEWGGNPVFLQKGDARLALFKATKNAQREPFAGLRLDHFAFHVEDRATLDRIHESLRAKGIAVEPEDHTVSCSLYIKDPDGHTVEFTTYDL